jgi:hypothetical protein
MIEAHGVPLAVPTSSVALTRVEGGAAAAGDAAADAGGAAVPAAAKPYSW